MAEVTAQIDTLLFGTPNPGGYELTIENDLDGWYDGPGVRVSDTARAWHHGSFSDRGYREARIVTAEGFCYANTLEAAIAGQRHLTSTLAEGRFGTLTVFDDAAGTLSSVVQLATAPKFRWVTENTARYLISVKANDPRKYGAVVNGLALVADPGGGLGWDLFTQETLGIMDFGSAGQAGTVTVYNPGTAESAPVFRINGPTMAASVITETSSQYRLIYDAAIPSGSYVTINAADGSVKLDGYADRSTSLVRRDWSVVGPGYTLTYLFESTGATSASMQVGVAPAWW